MRKKALCDLTPHPPNIHTQGDNQDLNHSPANCCGLGENVIGPFGYIHVEQVTVYECIIELINRHFEPEMGSVWSHCIFYHLSQYHDISGTILCFFYSSLTTTRKSEGTRCFFSCTMGFFISALL